MGTIRSCSFRSNIHQVFADSEQRTVKFPLSSFYLGFRIDEELFLENTFVNMLDGKFLLTNSQHLGQFSSNELKKAINEALNFIFFRRIFC